MTTQGSRDAWLGAPSNVLLRLFDPYLQWYLRRHFHGIRIANADRLESQAHPNIVYVNHASWWDPLTCMFLARRFFPGQAHYAPMDAESLNRYRILARLGMFPVEQGTRRGAAQFLRASDSILNAPASMLWITPQGAFNDVRRRPLEFRAGLASLLKRHMRAIAMPLAIEYTFWDERLPEVLIEVGQAQPLDRSQSAQAIQAALTCALSRTQDSLAAMAVARNPAAFQSLLGGRAGVGLAYDAWRRLQALVRGEGFQAEHGAGKNQFIEQERNIGNTRSQLASRSEVNRS